MISGRVHKKPVTPVERPAKIRHPDVIVARERAHAVFDLLWSCGYISKNAAYTWLREAFSRPKVEAHVGRMSIEECKRLEKMVAEKLKKTGVIKELARFQSEAAKLRNEKGTTNKAVKITEEEPGEVSK